LRVLETLLRLSHPFMPYITEELWQKVAPKVGISAETVDEIDWIKTFVLGIRKIRAEYDLPPGKALPVLCANASTENTKRVEQHTGLLQALAKTQEITILSKDEPDPDSATALVGDMRVLIPLAGLIDKAAEKERLDREEKNLTKEKSRLEGKLGNDSFVAKAPAAVVDKEKQKLADAIVALDQIQQQKERLESL